MLINDTYLVTSIKAPKEDIEKLKKYHLPIMFYDYSKGYYDAEGNYVEAPNGIWLDLKEDN